MRDMRQEEQRALTERAGEQRLEQQRGRAERMEESDGVASGEGEDIASGAESRARLRLAGGSARRHCNTGRSTNQSTN
jgi:hypothetical protein